MRFPLISLLLSVLFSLASCDNAPGGYKVVPDTPEKGETAQRTLLVYMMAENSLYKHAGYDIDEINKVAANVPSDCRLFVYVDDRSFPTMYQCFRCTDGTAGSSVFHPFDRDVCSSDTAALGKLLDYIIKDYPTEKLDLVLWSHGDGWLRTSKKVAPQRSIGIDNGENTFLDKVDTSIEMEELAALLERLPLKVDRLLFDACFMQCAESSYALRNAAEWIIASPAEVPGDGADYSLLVPEFFYSEGVEALMDAYMVPYEGKNKGAVMSAVRASEMQNLADVTSLYVSKYFGADKQYDYSSVFSYVPGGDYTSGRPYPCFFDLNAMMRKILSAEDYFHWRKAYDLAVVKLEASPGWYSLVCGRVLEFDVEAGGGMSAYFPRHDSNNAVFNSDFRTTEWYRAAGWQAAGW